MLMIMLTAVLLFAAVFPKTTVLAADEAADYSIEILPEEFTARLKELLSGNSHDASWYTEEAVYARMMALQSDYPEGRYWTNDNSYSRSYLWYGGKYDGRTVTYTGRGCVAFALIMSDAAFGSDLPIWQDYDVTFSKVRTGDILRVNNDSHSVIILSKNSSSVTIAEGNYNSSIHWGRTLSAAAVEEADYMLSRWPGTPRVTYTVTYNANGGTGAPAAQVKTQGVDLVLSSTRPVRNGYYFLGWAESASAAVPAYQPGDHFTSDANTTLYAVWGTPDLVLPASLTAIESDAFSGGAFRFVKLPDNTASIGSGAFSGCGNLLYIYIPDSAVSIDAGAFGNSGTVSILCRSGSHAEEFALTYGFRRILVP